MNKQELGERLSRWITEAIAVYNEINGDPEYSTGSAIACTVVELPIDVCMILSREGLIEFSSCSGGFYEYEINGEFIRIEPKKGKKHKHKLTVTKYDFLP